MVQVCKFNLTDSEKHIEEKNYSPQTHKILKLTHINLVGLYTSHETLNDRGFKDVNSCTINTLTWIKLILNCYPGHFSYSILLQINKKLKLYSNVYIYLNCNIHG